MELKLKTNPKQFEAANAVLATAIEQLEQNPVMLKSMGLKVTDLQHVKDFRKSLVNGIATSAKQ